MATRLIEDIIDSIFRHHPLRGKPRKNNRFKVSCVTVLFQIPNKLRNKISFDLFCLCFIVRNYCDDYPDLRLGTTGYSVGEPPKTSD